MTRRIRRHILADWILLPVSLKDDRAEKGLRVPGSGSAILSHKPSEARAWTDWTAGRDMAEGWSLLWCLDVSFYDYADTTVLQC